MKPTATFSLLGEFVLLSPTEQPLAIGRNSNKNFINLVKHETFK